MTIKNSLFARITIAFLCLITLLGVALLYLSQKMSDQYSREIMQRLNQSVAMYIAGQQPLIRNGEVDEAVVTELASRAMILNPSLEIYILDKNGNILGHRLPEESVQVSKIDLGSIKAYLTENAQMPILGEDPRFPEQQKAFSTAAITEYGETVGYVYAIIGGQMYQDLRSTVMQSYTLRVGAVLIISVILIAALSGSILFFIFTRRLSNLRKQVDQFGLAELGKAVDHDPQSKNIILPINLKSDQRAISIRNEGDEIHQLESAFYQMAEHINHQFEAIQSVDETRRELIANVSHDLRTPLASMQGYIETLIIKNAALDEVQRQNYLEIAHKHSQRLSRLVSELFELAKLESKGIEPKMEPFSLLELIHDSVQEFGLRAQSQNIKLDISKSPDCYVKADIALIHRVLQNLLDNALRHTPKDGTIRISLHSNEHSATVEVSDTGKGIQTKDIPFIFERFYKSQQQEPSEKIGAGLGLAIVKRILDLHQSHISVSSQLNKGTSFAFVLPQYS